MTDLPYLFSILFINDLGYSLYAVTGDMYISTSNMKTEQDDNSITNFGIGLETCWLTIVIDTSCNHVLIVKK